MKKVAAVLTSFGYLFTAASAFAATVPPEGVRVTLDKPTQGIDFATNPGVIIVNAINIIFIIAVLAVLLFLIIGAFSWITSSGDKERVAGARNTILNALIGLGVLAVAFLLANLAAGLFGFSLTEFTIPRLDTAGSPRPT